MSPCYCDQQREQKGKKNTAVYDSQKDLCDVRGEKLDISFGLRPAME
jgi:hypothetical protein